MTWFKPFDPVDAKSQQIIRDMNNSPRLYRTTTEAIAEKPRYATGQWWSAWMRTEFPAWRYHAAARRWHGPLADLEKMSKTFPYAIKSEGVKKYLEGRECE